MTTGEPLGPDTVVEVLEIGACDDGPGCYLGGEFIRFYSPVFGEDDWMHAVHFEKAADR